VVFKTWCRRPPNAKLVARVVVIIFIKRNTPRKSDYYRIESREVTLSESLFNGERKKMGRVTLSTSQGVKESLSFVGQPTAFFLSFAVEFFSWSWLLLLLF